RPPMKHRTVKHRTDRNAPKWFLTLGRAALLLALAVSLVSPSAFAGSSADEIKKCTDANWCSYHRTVDTAWRHSPLDQINTSNLKKLRPVWIFQPGDPRMGLHSPPLAVDGSMYVSTN